VIEAERWRDNWLAVSPDGAVRVELDRSRASRRVAQRTVRALPAGTPVVLSASAPGAIRRCRAFASGAGVELEREYLALPSAGAPAYLVEDAPGPIEVLVGSVLAAPPGTPFARTVDAGLALVRALRPWRVIRVLAPGRVAVGWRS
jgi:hypothetical protein